MLSVRHLCFCHMVLFSDTRRHQTVPMELKQLEVFSTISPRSWNEAFRPCGRAETEALALDERTAHGSLLAVVVATLDVLFDD